MRISPSTAAIFCSEVGCWRPIPRKDMIAVFGEWVGVRKGVCVVVSVVVEGDE